MMKTYGFVVMVILATLIGFSGSVQADIFTNSFGDFVSNQANGWGTTFTPGVGTIEPDGFPVPQTVYLKDWTFAKSSSGYGMTEGTTYLVIFSALTVETMNADTLVGVSSNYLDTVAPAPSELMTWYFDGVRLNRDTQYALMFSSTPDHTGIQMSQGVELETGNPYSGGGFIRLNSVANDWDPDYLATYDTEFTTFKIVGDPPIVIENTGNDTYDLQLLPDPNLLLETALRWPSGAVTVTLTPDDQVSVSPTSVVFPAWTGNPDDYVATITVTAVNDDIVEESVHTGLVTHTAASTDVRWDGKSIDVTVSIVDDDGPQGVLVSEIALWVGEGFDPNDTFTLVLSSPPVTGQSVTVTVNAGTQCKASPASAVFTETDWTTPQTITVGALDDAVAEGTHFSTITFSVASGDPGYNGMAIPELPVAIGDNELQGPAGITAKPAAWYNENSAVNRDTGYLSADGQTVNLWEDQSGHRRYARYYWTGRTYPDYDGTTNSLSFNDNQAIIADDNWGETGLAQPTTIFCVGKLNSVPVSVYLYDSMNSASRQMLSAYIGGKWQIGAGTYPQTSTWYLGGRVLNVITFNGASSVHRVNGTQVFSGNLGVQALDGMTIGSRVSAANFLRGQISEIIVYNEALLAADIQAVESYLFDKWGRIDVAETGGSTQVSEAAGQNTDTYTVVVFGTPSQPVAVTVTPTGDDAGDVNLGSGPGQPITLNFTSGATEIQTVTVTSVDNATSDGPRTVTLSHTAVSADPDYNNQTITDVVVTVIDDEPWCGQEGTVYFDADVNQDCYVTLADFAIMAAGWLDCTNPGDPECN